MENRLPKRKHPRLKDYDYRTAGAYFVTICTHERSCRLSRSVGRGLAPAATTDYTQSNSDDDSAYARSELTEYGKIAEKQLFMLEERYPYMKVDQYVIMPNHIHAIIIIEGDIKTCHDRSPLTDIICAYKSLTVRECKRESGFVEKLFQDSFYEHVIRNRYDYDEIRKYIYENPARWHFDKLFSET